MDKQKIKCTKQSLTLLEKKRILKEIDAELAKNGMNASLLSRKLNLPRTTLATILKNREVIEAATEDNNYRFRAPNKKSNPQKGVGKYVGLEKKLVMWITEQGGRPNVSSKDIKRKASEMSVEMGLAEFSASNGWMDRFDKRFTKQKICECRGSTALNLPPVKSENYLTYIMDNRKTDGSENVKLPKLEQYREVSRLLMTWQDLAESEGVRLTGSLLKDMSLATAAAIGANHFTASSGWLNKYQKRRPAKKCRVCLKNNKRL